ncbi:MAG: thiamine phosphate synthase [Deltaproteobacteria bacterium]|nr:thiamine phosphate synthase [Deltaproteobacteria bacterium]
MVWVLTDDEVEPARIAAGWGAITARVPGGRAGLSIRNRVLETRALLELCRNCVGAGGPVVVSRRVDLACVVDGLGVHLPAGGLPTAEVRRLLPAGRLLLRAAHDADELRAAAGADAVLVSPVFMPRSHAPVRPPLGNGGLARLVRLTTTPVVALGGIRAQDVSLVRAAGASGMAVIREAWGAADPAEAVAALVAAWDAAAGGLG